MPIWYPRVSSKIMHKKFHAFDELSRTIIMTLHQDSSVVLMDFNSLQETSTLGTFTFSTKLDIVKFIHLVVDQLFLLNNLKSLF